MRSMQKTISLLSMVALTTIFAAGALAQSLDDLKNDEKTPGDVLVYGMGYSGNRYSPLTQINKSNVKNLVPKWAFSITDNRGSEAFPLVKDGVIYVTSHTATVAVDAMTGKQIWRVNHEYPPETLRVVCCGIVNRGAAIYNGKIIRALLDNNIVALDAKTGKEVWQTPSPEPVDIRNGYAMTGAPIVANGVLIVGVAGAEYSHRGFVEGYDPETGKHLWRLYTIPAKGEPGLGHLGGRFRAHRRRQQLGHRHLRSGARSRLLGHRQSVAVERPRSQGRQSLHQLDLRGQAEDRRARLVLPDVAERSVRLRRRADTRHRDHQGRGQAAQGRHAGQPQRLPLCAGCEGRQAAGGQRVREGQLGRRRRSEDRTPQGQRRLQRRARRQERHGMAVGVRRNELAAHVVQSEDRDAVHQHHPCRHDLRSARAAATRARQAIRSRDGQTHDGHGRSERPRLPQGRRSDDRQRRSGKRPTRARTSRRPCRQRATSCSPA